VTIQEPVQVTSCCNLALVCQLSLNSRSARMSFSRVQRVFIVEHYLASRSYVTCQNEFSDPPVLNRSTICRLVKRFRETGSVQDRNRSDRLSVLSDDSLDDIRQTLLRSTQKPLRNLSLQSELCYGSGQIQHVSGIGWMTFRSPGTYIVFLTFSYMNIWFLCLETLSFGTRIDHVLR
jgi:hypothetical protein